MKFKLLKILPFVFITLRLHSQSVADSLINIYLSTQKPEQKISALENIIEADLDFPNDSLLLFVREGIRLSESLDNKKPHPVFYKVLAEIYEAQDSSFNAIEQYIKYIDICKLEGDKKSEALGYNRIGNIYFRMADYAESLKNHIISLQLREEIKDDEGIASSLNNIGTLYLRLDDYNQALDQLNKSLKIEQEAENEPGIASCYINIGAVYEKKLSFDTALHYYQQSIEINQRYDNAKDIASTYSNIAFIYDSKGSQDTALYYYLKSLNLFEDIEDRQGAAETYLSIGIFYNGMWEWKEALKYLERAMDIGKEIHSYDIVMRSAKELSEAFYKLNDFKKAYENHVLYKRAYDKINSEESIKKFTQVEMQREFEKKQKEQEFNRLIEKRKQKMINVFFIFGLTFMIILAWIMYRNYRIKHKANILLSKQKAEIQAQRDEITASIHYASRIQTAILPPRELREQILPEHFILYKPRDIVSGDYFWMTQKGDKTIVVAADCTGHGVPGAFMSMLGVVFLNEIVNKPGIKHANQILHELRDYIIKALHQTGKAGEQKDGMDMALVSLDCKTHEVEYSGAYNPLYHIRDGQLEELKADRMPIGIHLSLDPFTNQVIKVKPGDTLYMFSDGYVDQFGGALGKKFKAPQFKELLLSIQEKPMSEQKELLNESIEKWREGYDQIDDILVIGIRVE
ncbi:MAG: tetratricopeptide repeat protein [Bacteroidales bacterium]|nr:tetratricopeptide repeat protein [Bacteroidales bacterium]